MTAQAETLKPLLQSLSDNDRGELAHFLISSLDEPAEPGAEAAWDAELERRKAEILSGRAKGRTAEEVFADLDASFQ